jgi:hypothetical protein
MLLHTPFCSRWKRLQSAVSAARRPTKSAGAIERTFAISLHEDPASRIVFSLCSSAGDHGVFVRDFFAEGGDKVGPSVGACGPVAFVVPVFVGGGPEARRFLPLVGEGGTAKPLDCGTPVSDASTGGWICSV